MAVAPVKVFLSYAHEDRAKVHKLYRSLTAAGFAPWLDDENLLPGQDWENEINRSMRESDFVILCLSNASVAKQGYVQTEMQNALALLNTYPQDTVYLIPARLDDCPIPKSLARKQAADLFNPNGLSKVIKALEFETARRNRKPAPATPKTTFADIGFSVDAKTKNSVEKLQRASDQLRPGLAAMADAQHRLSATVGKLGQVSSRWEGKVEFNEIVRRLELIQGLIGVAWNTFESTTPALNFLTFGRPDVGIGPGNIDAVRNDYHNMITQLPTALTRITEFFNGLQSAAWLPADLRDPLLEDTRQLAANADQVRRQLAAIGKI